MKKILSFTLVLAMILGSVSFCFAGNASAAKNIIFATESFTDVKKTDDCFEAVEVLKAIGAVDGTSEGRFQPEATLTRAQIVAFVVKALGYPVTEGNSYVTKFADVPATSWFAGYVYWGANLGIVEGRTATKFDPNAKVTADEATAFILRILGYNDTVTGGYPAGYILAANGYDFYDIISAGSASVTRGQTAQMIYEIADEPFGSVAEFNYAGVKKGTFVAPVKGADEAVTIYDKHDCTVGNAGILEAGTAKEYANYMDLTAFVGSFGTLVTKKNPAFNAKEKESLTNKQVIPVAYYPATVFVTGFTGDTVVNGTLGGYKFAASFTTTVAPTYNVINGYKSRTDAAKFSFSTTTPDTNKYAVKINEDGLISEVVSVVKEEITKYAIAYDATGLAEIYTAAKAPKTAGGAVTGAKVLGTTLKTAKTESDTFGMVPDATGRITTEFDCSGVEFVGLEKFEDVKVGDLLALYYAGEKLVKVELVDSTVTGYVEKTVVGVGKDSDGKAIADKYVIAGTTYSNSTKYVVGTNVAVYKATDYKAPEAKTWTYYLDVDGKLLDGVKLPVEETKTVTGLALKVENSYSATLDTLVTVLNADGTVATYPVNKVNNKKMTVGNVQGKLVQYQVVDGKLIAIAAVDTLTTFDSKTVETSGAAISAKGVTTVDSTKYMIKKDTVVFEFVGNFMSDKTKAENWKVITGADLYDEELESATKLYCAQGSKYVDYVVGSVDAEMVYDHYILTGKSEVRSLSEVYNEYTAINLEKGTTETFKVTGNYNVSQAPAAAKVFVVTGEDKNGFTTLTEAYTTLGAIYNWYLENNCEQEKLVTKTGATVGVKYDDGKLLGYSSTATTLTEKDYTLYADVAENAKVYVYDEATETWTIGTTAKLSQKWTAADIYGYKNVLCEDAEDATEAYDMFVVVVKKAVN